MARMAEAEKHTILTPEGLRKLEDELEHLKTVKRKEIAARIKASKEYEDAKNEQAFIEGRILQLDQMLRNAQVIDNHNAPRDTITVGSTVRVKDMGSGEEISYTIVGSAEADPDKDKISNESPVGRALLGRRTGEVVEVTVPAGKMKYSVLK